MTDSVAKMDPHEDQDRKIVLEFCHLLEKSKQLFNGLRLVIHFHMYICYWYIEAIGKGDWNKFRSKLKDNL